MTDQVDAAIATLERNGKNGHGRGRKVSDADDIFGPEEYVRLVPVPGARAPGAAPRPEPGRQAALTEGGLWDLANMDTAKRPLGREKATLDALKAIRDLDPEVSDAVWVWQRLLNSGVELKARSYTQDGGEEDEAGEAQTYLDELTRRVGTEYGGGLDQLLPVLSLEVMTYGAVAAECAPTEDLRDTEDWYAIDPTLLAFKRVKLDNGKRVLVLGQRKAGGRFTALPQDQVFYIPLDSDVGDPYGRPPFLPVIAAAIAKAQVLNDVKAYAHQFGYPRIHVKVLWDRIKADAPPALKAPEKAKELAAWARGMLQTIVEDYTKLYVDDTFVHYDTLEPAYLARAGGDFDFGKLIEVLERQVHQAAKMLPVLLGINDSTTETHGTVQWQIQVAGVRTVQRILKRLVERLANVSLALAGFQAHAWLGFDEIRDIDVLYESQAKLILYNALKVAQDQGWIDGDEAAELTFEHEAVGEPIAEAGFGAFSPITEMTDSAKVAWRLAQVEGTGAKAKAERERIMADAGRLTPTRRRILLRAGDLVREALAARPQARAIAADDETIDGYRKEGRRIFLKLGEEVAAALEAEGIVSESPVSRRDVAAEIAKRAFGRGYAREMKGLLRRSLEHGMTRSGLEDPTAPERLVNRIWKGNAKYVAKIQGELATAIRAGDFTSVGDVAGWFQQEAYRSELMGAFLGKQGEESGYVAGVETQRPDATFTWALGGTVDHCDDCLERDGQSYTAAELDDIGYPGSDSLACAGGCGCSVEEDQA